MGGSLAHINLPPSLASASFNADNQLTQWGGTAMSYDFDGNLLNDGAHTYSWNVRKQLAAIDGGSTASFVYGPFGHRVSKTVYGVNTGYLYDGANVVQELSGGNPSANLLSGGLDEVFTRTDSNGVADFIRDGLGSTAALTDSTGAISQTYTYDPFGATSTSGGSTNSYQYIGREADATGLYFLRARYYNPATGRFLSEDPAGFSGSGPNLYAYVGNNPMMRVDPDGHGCAKASGGSAPECMNAAEKVNALEDYIFGGGVGKRPGDSAQQQTDNKPVGSTTVGSLEKTMTHEDGSLSTPKGGDPTELEKGKTALANAIINGAESKHPPLVATPTVPASSQDAQIMRDAYTNRANGGADPVNGRTFYGTSHTPPDQLHSRPIGNGRQTVYEHFGPFNDSVGGGRQTYIYIYNDPGH